jgi:predicted transcriptional regulator
VRLSASVKRHLKCDVLRLFAEGGSWQHGEIAPDANFWPIRVVSTYMRRLERQGLVQSARPYKRGVWRITEKG